MNCAFGARCLTRMTHRTGRGVTIGEGDLIGTSEQLLAASLSDEVCIVGDVQVAIAINLPMLGARPSAAFILLGAFPDL
jgi:hypothetical protein